MNLIELRTEHIPLVLPLWNKPDVLSTLAPSMAQLTEGSLTDLLIGTSAGTYSKAWGVVLDDAIVGTIALSNMNPVSHSGEITNRVMAEKVGFLVGLAALKAALSIGFDDFNLNRISCYVHEDNKATHAICKKVKAQLEGINREAAFKNGQFVDVYIYALLRSNWNG